MQTTTQYFPRDFVYTFMNSNKLLIKKKQLETDRKISRTHFRPGEISSSRAEKFSQIQQNSFNKGRVRFQTVSMRHEQQSSYRISNRRSVFVVSEFWKTHLEMCAKNPHFLLLQRRLSSPFVSSLRERAGVKRINIETHKTGEIRNKGPLRLRGGQRAKFDD